MTYNDETTIEQMDNEYDCIGKLGDEICQSLFDEKQKNSEKRFQHALRSINKMKGKYLENTINCLELQVLDVYEYLKKQERTRLDKEIALCNKKMMLYLYFSYMDNISCHG
jgi:hypothetical protein